MTPWDLQHAFWMAMVTTVQNDNAKSYHGIRNLILPTILDKYVLPGCNFINRA